MDKKTEDGIVNNRQGIYKTFTPVSQRKYERINKIVELLEKDSRMQLAEMTKLSDTKPVRGFDWFLTA